MERTTSNSSQKLFHRPLPRASFRITQRVARILCNILMTADDLQWADRSLRGLDERILSALVRQVPLAMSFLRFSFAFTAPWNVSAYRNDADAPINFELSVRAAAELDPGNSGDHGYLLPPAQFLSTQQPDCCGYRDFAAGPGVIAYRGVKPLSGIDLERAHMVATYEKETDYPEASAESVLIPLTALLSQSRQAAILRIDPAFPVAYTGRKGAFSVLVSRKGDKE